MEKLSYGRLPELELAVQAQDLLRVFEEAWSRKYGARYIGSSPTVDLTTCKDMVRWYGLDRARAMIELYLSSEDPWILKRAHSLDIVRGQFNKLTADLARKEKNFLPPGEKDPERGLMIQIIANCKNANCKERFTVICNSNNVAEETWGHLCATCKAKSPE